jgi:hypothetical protein
MHQTNDIKVIPAEKLSWIRHDIEYETAALSGEPQQPGSLYALRYRTTVSCDVPAHWHPEDEHVTVIAGEFRLGFGEIFSIDALRPLVPGSCALVPHHQAHFARYGPGAIVQVHGIGPLTINYIEK